MNEILVASVTTSLVLIIGFAFLAYDLRGQLTYLRVPDSKSYRPMYRELNMWQRLKVVLMPGLFKQLENAYTARIQSWSATDELYIRQSQILFTPDQIKALHALAVAYIDDYNGSILEYWQPSQKRSSSPDDWARS